eukprot:6184347-Pleurochrysis_carterae.AAC.5
MPSLRSIPAASVEPSASASTSSSVCGSVCGAFEDKPLRAVPPPSLNWPPSPDALELSPLPDVLNAPRAAPRVPPPLCACITSRLSTAHPPASTTPLHTAAQPSDSASSASSAEICTAADDGLARPSPFAPPRRPPPSPSPACNSASNIASAPAPCARSLNLPARLPSCSTSRSSAAAAPAATSSFSCDSSASSGDGSTTRRDSSSAVSTSFEIDACSRRDRELARPSNVLPLSSARPRLLPSDVAPSRAWPPVAFVFFDGVKKRPRALLAPAAALPGAPRRITSSVCEDEMMVSNRLSLSGVALWSAGTSQNACFMRVWRCVPVS